MLKNYKISIIGLGYVGLPLAVEFSKKYKTIGYDINEERVKELNNYTDKTLEISKDSLKGVLNKSLIDQDDIKKGLFITSDYKQIQESNFYIITVPTPVDNNNKPNLIPLEESSRLVGSLLRKDSIVIYESTVYPGATEEFCVPILEKASGLKFNIDFFVGYSPERINPGDKNKTLTKILKVTSGSTIDVANEINDLYKSIIEAGTFLAKSIKVAEAAKVIENSQRDINIAFVNELAKIFNRLDIDTNSVLEAASTKWNFLPFKPGLVGGHCIGVDPYYLAQKAVEVGYNPEIILSGRRLNDGMGQYIARQVVKLMINKSISIHKSNVLILGITFKENCPDIRNSKVIDIYNELKSFNINIDVHDPWADYNECKNEFGIELKKEIDSNYDGIILAVSHFEFKNYKYRQILNKDGLIYDVKGFLDEKITHARL